MADYENRPVPEGINVSPSHPLREFALLVAGISGLILVVTLVVSLLAGQFARHIPFTEEKALAESLATRWPTTAGNQLDQQRQTYLQNLADRLGAVMNLPAGMNITVHYASSDTVNAMATLGGHIIVFQGLIDSLPDENALAMVVAHEIAHVRNRHPIVAIGRGFAVAMTLSSLSGLGDGLMEQWVGGLGMLPVLSFSRGQEEEADADALEALYRLYGHVEGATSFFEKIARQEASASSPALFNTHPGTEARIERIRQFAQTHPAQEKVVLVDLPDGIKTGANSP
ncbi:M48 family metallopeptidase [Dechloromonas denitrificans]|uniref:M48 family metallopeptidase n=1 Tax=Dechloromonas denitrificans TaxID=281362 RepID=UPI001CF7F906|nr:M48 family metallopeptidase [Dechloromonas denitrificans]UCV10271.1 M48 family metallopeptidase [Dechloromonas denitrificans]